MIFKTSNLWFLTLILCTALVTAQPQQPCNLLAVFLRPGETRCQNICPPTTPSTQCFSFLVGVTLFLCPPTCCISGFSCLTIIRT